MRPKQIMSRVPPEPRAHTRRALLSAAAATFTAAELGIVPRSSAGPGPAPDGVSSPPYRWRLGLADGERRYDELERRLASGPVIAVPTITLEGDANGAPHPEPASYKGKFTGRYAHRLVTGGIGHNLPQEAPHHFAQAVLEAGAT